MSFTKIPRTLLNTGVSDSSDATAITIDSSENVGIGTTSPSDKLEIGTTTTGGNLGLKSSSYGNSGLARFYGTDGIEKLQIGSLSATSAFIYTPASTDLITYTGASERMRIDSSGNVGIGEDDPQTKLHVYGTNPVIRVSDDGTSGFSTLELRQQNTTTEGSELMYNSSTGHTHLNTVFGGDLKIATDTGSFGTTSTKIRLTVKSDGEIHVGSSNVSTDRIKFVSNANVSAPNPSNHASGTRLEYYSSSPESWYATGISGNTLWNVADKVHQWFDANSGGTSGTQTLRLTREGLTIPTATSDGTGSWGSGANTNTGLEAGMMYFNTTNNNFKGYNGSNWIDITSGSLTTINGLQLWADVTTGSSSSTISDLSGNNRSGTKYNATTGTLNGNTYLDFGASNRFVEYGASVLPDTSYAGSNACSYFFVCTNVRTLNSYASYITQVSNVQAYQIIRHNGASDDYNLYSTNLSNSGHTSTTGITSIPVNATINEAYIIIFQFKTVGSNTIFDVYKHENGTTYNEQYTIGSVSTGSFNWTGNGTVTRIGNSSWANEYFNGGMFAWGFTNTHLTAADRTVIYNYYANKGLAN